MAYIGRQQDGFGVRSRFIYTATGGQTTFTTDDSNNALSYSDGAYVDVYLNGVLLDPADYTATSLTSIVLDSGATASDILEVIVYDVFSVFSGTFTNGITASEATVTGDLTVDTNTLFVDSTNSRVGVGTVTPSSFFSDANQLVVGSGSGSQGITISSGTSENAQIFFADGTSGNAAYRGIVRYLHSSDAMAFYTSGANERMRIDSSGNVGIGTTSPDGLAHVYNGMLQVGSKTGDTSIQQNANAIRISAVPNSSTEWGGLQWYREFSDVIGAEIIASRPSSAETDTDLIFKTSTNSSNAVEVARITHGGNVGIGTTSPAVNLDVSGASADVRVAPSTTTNSAYYRAVNGAGQAYIGLDNSTGGLGGAYSLNFWHSGAYPVVFATNNTERMRLDSSGNLLVGTTGLPSSTNKGTALRPVSLDRTIIQMSSASVSTGVELIQFRNPNGQVGYIATNANSTTYATSSDYRLKENVTDITDGIIRVKQLNPLRFNFISDASTIVDGFLAHEVSDVVPEAITGKKDAMMDEEYEVTPAVLDDDGNVVTEAVMGTRSVPDYQGIDQSKLVPLLTAALQEAITKIETLEIQRADLETRLTTLENA